MYRDCSAGSHDRETDIETRGVLTLCPTCLTPGILATYSVKNGSIVPSAAVVVIQSFSWLCLLDMRLLVGLAIEWQPDGRLGRGRVWLLRPFFVWTIFFLIINAFDCFVSGEIQAVYRSSSFVNDLGVNSLSPLLLPRHWIILPFSFYSLLSPWIFSYRPTWCRT